MSDDEVRAMRFERDADGYWQRPSLNGNGHTPVNVHLLRADQVAPESVRWAERDWLPLGAVSLLAARKGEGKSTIAYDRLARATRGQLPGDLDGPATVVIATAEDHRAQVAVPRLIAAGADLGRVRFVTVRDEIGERGLDLPDDLPALRAAVAEANARVLFLDPLVAHMPVMVDSHKDQHVRRVLAPLGRLAEELDLAVLATIHFNKAPGVDALNRISGSGGFVNAARAVLCAASDPEDETRRLLWREVTNLAGGRVGRAYRIETRRIEGADGAEIETSGVAWLGDVEVDSRRVMAGPESPEERNDRDDAADWLRDLLPAPAKQIKAAASEAGFAWRTVHRAKDKIGARSEKFGAPGEPGHWVWTLPKVPPNPEDATSQGMAPSGSRGTFERPRSNDEDLLHPATQSDDPDQCTSVALPWKP
ncbi:MAG: AAA family ATPase [Actinomycetota bacterium]|nr:AAA family ATPase [Actinomycetota bacterium]